MTIRIGGMPQITRIEIPQAQKPAEAAPAAKGFGEFLQEALNKVEALQQDAAQASERLATGEIRDVADVMIASEKATIALQLTVQVRNKVLEAYQEIMRMPV